MNRKMRKLIWSAPLVAVLAVAGALAIFAALSPNWAQAHEGNMAADPPGPATGLTAESDGYNVIVLKWDPPASTAGGAPTGYRIDIAASASNPHVWQFHEAIGVNVSGAKHTYTDRMDLSAGDQRRYRVTGFNDAGIGATSILPSSIVGLTAPATIPGPVLALKASAGSGDDTGSILLEWNNPTDMGGEDVARYCIVTSMTRTDVAAGVPNRTNCAHMSAVPSMWPDGNYHTIVVDGEASTYKHSNTFDSNNRDEPVALIAGGTWYYRAYAVNSEGWSTVASNIATARVATGARAPTTAAPTDLRVVWNDDNSNAHLYWNWPKGHTGTAFEVQRSTSNSFPSTATDPDAATPINVGVLVLDEIVQGEGDGGVTVPDKDFLYYRVRAGTDGEWSDYAVRPSENDDGSIILAKGMPAIYGQSATLADDKPIAAVADGEDGYTVLELTWTPDLGTEAEPIEGPSGYEIDRRSGAGPWQRLQRDTTYTCCEYSDVDLTPGTMYTYRIFPLYSSERVGTKNVPVYGTPITVSESTRMPTSPDPVRGLRVMADGPTAFNLEWDAVTETGGADIKFFVVQVVDDGDKDLVIDTEVGSTAWVEANGAGKGRTAADTTEYSYEPTGTDALSGGDVRWFRVFAINQADSTAAGDEDDPMDDMVTDTALDKVAATPKRGQTDASVPPNPPVDLSAETARDSSGKEVPDRGVLLIWNMPDNPQGATIAHYVVERMKDDGAWEEIGKTSTRSPDDRTYFNDRNKQVAGELRTYRVAAVSNTDAQGGWSNEATLLNGQTSHSHNTAPMAGDAIADQTVTAGQSVMVQSTITDADMGDTLMWSVMSSMEMYATAEVDNMGMVTIMGVAAGMATITVTATDMAGAMVTQEIMVTVNTAPMTVGTIAAVTVAAGQMSEMDVSGYFSDADTGDTLKYTAMSDMEMYATVMVDGSMLTITGVAAGMATITVTATDAAGAYAMQTIMVTVEAVDTTPMAPTSVMATVDDSDPGSTSVTVTWTDGANVPAHGVVLFANNFTEWNYIGKGTGGSLTFTEVASGSYIAVVVALDAQGGLMIDAQGNYLYAGATVVSVQ